MRRSVVAAALVTLLVAVARVPAPAGAVFDQPRPRGAELPHVPAGPVRGCPREAILRLSALEAWVRELPLGEMLAGVVRGAGERACARG